MTLRDEGSPMEESAGLAAQFEEHRAHLRAVAYRMLGSLNDADDALQNAWVRVGNADTSVVACRPRRCPTVIWRANERSSTRSSPRRVVAISTRWSRCSIRMSYCETTRESRVRIRR